MLDYIPIETAPTSDLIVHERVMHLPAPSWEIPLSETAGYHLASMSDEELDQDWKLNEFFGTIAVINLEEDKERLARVTEELQAVGTSDFEVFPAINGREELDASIWMKLRHNRSDFDNSTKEGKLALERLHQGEAGCFMSHYLLLKRTKDAFDAALKRLKASLLLHDEEEIHKSILNVRKYSRLLIFEDDNGFGIVNETKTDRSKEKTGTLLRSALQELPKRWDMLYFMCAAHQKTKATSSHLRQLKRSVFLNAYVVNYTMYEPLIKTLEAIENPRIKHVLPVDKAISAIHHQHHVFAIYPSLAFQFDGKSSIDLTTKQTLTQCQPILPKRKK